MAQGAYHHREHGRAYQQPVRDHAQGVRRLGVRGVPVSGSLVGQDEVTHLAARRAEREQQPDRVEAQSGPHLDDAGEPADRQHHPGGGGAGDGAPLHEADPAEDQSGRQVFDEESDADRDARDRGEVEGLDACHGEQPETGQQYGPLPQEIPVPPGHRQHDQCGAGHPEPDHVQRVQARLDQRLGRNP